MSFQELATPNPPISSRESSVSLQIFKINANVQGIRSLSEKIGTIRDSHSLRTRLRDLTETTRALVHRASEEMRSLAAQLTQGIAVKKLASDLDTSVRNFQAAQEFSAACQRAHVVSVPHSAPVPTSEPLVDVSESTQTQIQTQTQVVYATEDAFREAEIWERHAAIQELEAGMQDVAEIMRTLGSIVERQGEDIDTMQWNTEQTARDLEAGTQQLETAARHQRRARRTCLKIILGVVCAVVILAVVF
ncbi:t-SNARE [Mycena sanguinolenta]|uniref:t-SNARE n=1 Tax=Mycena sanguinolenta TaxID=230812 RepID=A0A8H6XH29_9AGAR|nr:t-SNARE [Mycena sanguinolenta]